MTDNQCQYQFTWSDEKERDFSQYGDIERNGGTETPIQIIGIINEQRILEHSCSRQAEDDADFCIWHNVRENKTTDEVKGALSEEGELITEPYLRDATFENLDLSNYTILWGKFGDSDITRVDLSFATICLSDFDDATLKEVNFNGANLSGTRFVDTTFLKPSSGHQSTTFSDSNCAGTNFIDADFKTTPVFEGAQFDRSTQLCRNLMDANLEGADLSETEFTDLTLTGANLKEANLSSADIQANFTNADLSNIYAFDADFSNSKLERAVLDGANLQSANLRGAKIHSAVISDAVIDHDTKFDRISPYEIAAKAEQNQDSKIEHINRAIWSYNSLSRLSKENALSKQAQQYYIKEKDLKRKLSWLELCGPVSSSSDGRVGTIKAKMGQFQNLLAVSDTPEKQFRTRFVGQFRLLLKSLKAEISRRTIKYGEGHWNVLFSLGVVTLLYSLIYPIWGIQQGNKVLRYSVTLNGILSGDLYIDWEIWVNSIYFSVVTFTTLGYGDIQPVGFAKYIAASEAVIGASLMALLVFVLGRRATW
ncbi:pentapeptide repeat-containing protein [Halobacterium salinarum]|uniref:pentapeptide repeat-containing protein n=1 Tax=Halobacterium salinarum TaxID=2242 RepID=UPI002554BB4D|nr:pentapeptide repeat-containing protein [Halobacterium salinarum]MDL0143640.1 pentapeptide repeat-containing protein [Halobacterium salinarum]